MQRFGVTRNAATQMHAQRPPWLRRRTREAGSEAGEQILLPPAEGFGRKGVGIVGTTEDEYVGRETGAAGRARAYRLLYHQNTTSGQSAQAPSHLTSSAFAWPRLARDQATWEGRANPAGLLRRGGKPSRKGSRSFGPPLPLGVRSSFGAAAWRGKKALGPYDPTYCL